MKYVWLTLTALFAISVSAWAQTDLPTRPDTSRSVPADPGMVIKRDPSMRVPSDSGAIVVPPRTGTEEMVTRPKDVDPGITAPANPKHRQKSAGESEEKQKSR